MRRATAWSVRGVERATQEIAEEAARRAGMSLGDWLDQVVADQAADQGLTTDELDEDDKLEAIGDRLARLSRRGDREPLRHSRDENARTFRHEPKASFEDADRAQRRLEAAIVKFESRATKNEERTAKAFESVASWIERSQADRLEERETLQTVAEKLAAIESQANRRSESPQPEAARDLFGEDDDDSGIDARLDELARRVSSRGRPRSNIRQRSDRVGLDNQNSESRNQRRQQEPEARRTPPPRYESAPQESERETLFGVHEKLANLEKRAARAEEAIRPTYSRSESNGRDIEARLEELARRVAANEQARLEALSRPAVAEMPEPKPPHRAEVRLREPAPKMESVAPDALRRGWRHFGVDVSAAPSPPAQPHAPLQAAQAGAPVEALRDEISALSARLERMRAAQAARRPTPTDADGLRAGLRSMARSVADIAPRNGAVALEGAVGDLGQRLSEARQAGASEYLLAPVEAKLSQVLEALRERDPHAAAETLERELRALSAKIEALSTAVINPSLLEAIRAQTEDVRNMLAAAAKTPVPVERLERQIGSLAERVERLASNPAPRAEIAQVLQLLADAQSQIERSTPAAVLTSIERRIEQLAARIDEAIRRPAPTMDPRPIEDLTRRIEGMRASIEKQAIPGPQVVALEAALRDINAKLDRAPTASLDSKAIVATLQEMTGRWEEGLRRPTSAQIDPQPIEDLARQIEGVRASVEKHANFGTHAAKLEAALGDISSKLDRPAPPALDSKSVMATLHDLAGRMEETFRQPPTARIDPQPIEDLARRIEGVRASVEKHADFGAHAAKLEAALGDISLKLDRPPVPVLESKALTSTLQDLTAKLEEAFRRPAPTANLDSRPLEDLARRIDDVRASVESQSVRRPDTSRLETALSEVSAKLDRQTLSTEDTGVLIDAIQELASKIDKGSAPVLDTAPLEMALRNLGERSVEIDTGPIESLLRDFSDKFSAPLNPPPIDTTPIERMLERFDAKLDAVTRPGADIRPLELAIRELHERLDFPSEPQIDARLVEQAAELIAKRLEIRGGTALDTEALVNQISEIHGRLDSLSIASASHPAFERTVAELIEELETTQQILQAKAAQPAVPPAFANAIAEWRIEQANGDRRMDTRFADIQSILEKLVDRLAQMEEDAALHDPRDGAKSPAKPNFVPAAAGALAPSGTGNLNLRNIPDRAPGLAPRVAVPASARPMGGADFLLEPGVAAPARKRDSAPEAPAKNAAINAHIAAARRAAQAAQAESAARDEDSAAARDSAAAASSARSVIVQAQAFIANRKRPLLLGGAALVAIVATLAVVGLRGGQTPAIQKSDLSAPVQSPAPIASRPVDETNPKAAAVDNAPTGAIAPIAPKAPAAPAPADAAIAPTDLMSALPATLPAALRDAAATGDAGAETEIALRYIEGRTIPRDAKAAARWFELAAAKGLPIAQYRLAAAYEKGIGEIRDVPLARAWYLKAANAGNARAMHNLAVLNAEDGGAGKPDYAEATRWFQRAAELGVRDSQFNLGVLYGRGLGVAQDLGRSWMWFSLASQQGDSDAAKKRDEVAARLDAKALEAASKSLAEFKTLTPSPAANEAPAPSGGWDGKSGAPQAGRLPLLAQPPASHG